MAWQVEQDRADRPAVLGTVHHASEHQDGADRLDAEGQRQQDRDGGERAHAGEHTDHVADQHADEAPHQVLRLERNAEAVPEIRERGVNHSRLHPMNFRTGIGICNTKWNSMTPKKVISADRRNDPTQVASLSPSAATNTHMNVAGASPPSEPNTMKAIGLSRMQAQANHCGSAGRMPGHMCISVPTL